MSDPAEIERLRADARYARERRDLYQAKVFGPRATDPGRLRELQRACDRAEARLAHAERGRRPPPPGAQTA